MTSLTLKAIISQPSLDSIAILYFLQGGQLLQQETVSLVGTINRITYHNPDTGYSILKVFSKNQSSNNEVTVIIHQADVYAGAFVEFKGIWINHPKFGRQFKASQSLEKKPASIAALERYLGSGLIKGVGPITAKKIVSHFGQDTLDIFEDNIEKLLLVPTIAHKKLKQIRSSWEEHKSIRDVMIFLQSHNISTLYAVKIYKRFGNQSIQTVSENPYRLAKDIRGIGFLSADRIASSLGIKDNHPLRIEAGINHILLNSSDEGHCYLTENQIISKVCDLTQTKDESIVIDLIHQLEDRNEIKKRVINVNNEELSCFYSRSIYFDETYIADKIKKLLNTQFTCNQNQINQSLNHLLIKSQSSLSEEQKQSIVGICKHSFSILTGGPGCGKTFTTKTLVQLLKSLKKSILLAAPTGRAAQRMMEVINHEAKTIHRLLEFTPKSGRFIKDEQNSLNADFIIIDESSMLDIHLTASLLRAVKIGTQLLFIGDPDQLPSVGAGHVLHDLINNSKVPQFKLTKIFRQAQESNIIRFAHQINQGSIPKITSPISNPKLWKSSCDCLFIDADEATSEQKRFVRKFKALTEEIKKNNSTGYLTQNQKITHQIQPNNHEIDVESLLVPSEIPSKPFPIFSIPEKFYHIDFKRLAASQSLTDELKAILKKIHPWSTLHFGYNTLETIKRIYTQTIPKEYGKNREIQILCPQIRGTLGTQNLNIIIQDTINPESPNKSQITFSDRCFRVNDRVIQTQNNYDLGVYNGDIGIITTIDPKTKSCLIQFPNQISPIHFKQEHLPEIQLAYAITIHKAQGSEFEFVIIPIDMQHFRMLFRNLIYTGLTRAKKGAIFVGNRKALAYGIKNIDNRKRQSNLKSLI